MYFPGAKLRRVKKKLSSWCQVVPVEFYIYIWGDNGWVGCVWDTSPGIDLLSSLEVELSLYDPMGICHFGASGTAVLSNDVPALVRCICAVRCNCWLGFGTLAWQHTCPSCELAFEFNWNFELPASFFK